ncbi:MAG: hypothetical protein FWB91_00330 [Defluviitaleaceae bacterium]|nr:hypothetical protein [Defluviitaleaceae bacterium]
MQAIDDLLEQIKNLMAVQARMKAANKHYRKNGTMKGFEGREDWLPTSWDAGIKYDGRKVPYPPSKLAKNGAAIRRLKPKLQKLQDQQMEGSGEYAYA